MIYQPTPQEQAVLSAAGYTGFPTSGANITNTPFPKWPCIAEALQLGDPDETCDGVNIYSKEVQNEYGFSGQFTWITSPKIGRNQFAAGAALDRGSVDYTQNTDYAYVNPNYTLTSVPAWQDGSTSADGSPVDSAVNLHGLTPNWSLYFTDTLTLAKTVNVTVSGRYNRFTDRQYRPAQSHSRTRLARWRLCISAIQPRHRDYLEPHLQRECLCEILPGQPRPDFH